MTDQKLGLKETLIEYRKYCVDLPVLASSVTSAISDNPWMSVVPVSIGAIAAYTHNSSDINPLMRLFNLAASIATGITVAHMAHQGLEAYDISNYFTHVGRDVLGAFAGFSVLRTVNSLSNPSNQAPKPPQ